MGLICPEDGGLGGRGAAGRPHGPDTGQGQGTGLGKPSATSRRQVRAAAVPTGHSSSGSVPMQGPTHTARPGRLGAHRGRPEAGRLEAGAGESGPGADSVRALTRAQPLRVLLVLLLLLPPGQLLHLMRREPQLDGRGSGPRGPAGAQASWTGHMHGRNTPPEVTRTEPRLRSSAWS